MKNSNLLNPTDILQFPSEWSKFKFYNLFSTVKEISNDADNEIVFSLTKKGLIKKDLDSNVGQMANSYDKYIKVEKNDIVFNPMDLISGWVDIVPHQGLVSPSYLSFRPSKKNVNSKFISLIFQSLYENRMLYNFGKGVSTHDGFGRWTISSNDILSTKISLPNKQLQDLLVEIFLKKAFLIDEIISNLENKIALLKEQKTTFIFDCITKGINKNIEMVKCNLQYIDKNPKHWKYFKIKHLAVIKKGKMPNKLQTEVNNFPYLDMKSLRGKEPSYYSTDGSGLFVSKGSNAILWDGSNAGEVVKIDKDGILSSTVAVFQEKENLITPEYFYFLLLGFEHFFKSYTVGMGIPHVNGEYFRNFKVAIPPISEQKSSLNYINKKTQTLESKILKLVDKVNLLNELKSSIRFSIISGEILTNEKIL